MNLQRYDADWPRSGFVVCAENYAASRILADINQYWLSRVIFSTDHKALIEATKNR